MPNVMNSAIYIYSGVKLDKAHNDVTNLTTSALMTQLANNNQLIASRTNYSFIRDRGTIKADFTYTQALTCNYMIYQNPSYDNKLFCAFIDHIEYLNEGTVEISYTIDNWQTWFSGLSVHDVLVEREHISNDSAYLSGNLLPEPISPSRMVIDSVHRLDLGEYCIIVCYTPVEVTDNPAGYVAGEMVSGAKIKKFRTHSLTYPDQNRVPDLSDFYDWVNDFQGDYETIVSIFMYPSDFVTISDADADFTQYGQVESKELHIPEKTSLLGYTPKNKKCFTYPFMYLSADTGDAFNIYKPELFYQNNVVVPAISGYTFIVYGCAMPTAELNLYAKYYNGFNGGENQLDYNRTEKLPLNQFPQISFPIDTYKAWLAQCQNTALYNILEGMVTGGLNGLSSGGGYGALANMAGAGLGGVGSYNITKNVTMKEASNKWMGSQGGSIDLALDTLEYDIKVMCPPLEELKAIDDFFSMFGYSVEQNKIPNIATRTNWNYVKVRGTCVYGSAPSEALLEINSIFEKGVTIWHSATNIGNYGDMSNAVVI